MSTEIGDLTTSGTIQQTRRVYKSDGSKQVSYVVATANEATFLSNYLIGTSTDDSLFLGEINVQKSKGVSRIDLTYVTPQVLNDKYKTGSDPVKSSSASVSSRPIWQHPLCDNPNGYLNNEVPSVNGTEYPGVDSYFVPNITYTRDEQLSSFSFTPSNLLDDVGRTQAPTGLSGATAQQWLKVSKEVDQSGEVYTIRETWQHAGISAGTANVWPTDIYGPSV